MPKAPLACLWTSASVFASLEPARPRRAQAARSIMPGSVGWLRMEFGTRFEEQRQLHLPQKHKATVADSTLRVEMNGLEEQADNTKVRELF